MKCECGNDKFYAHQVCRMDVIVNEHNDWEKNSPDDNSACYDADSPYGPYRCTKCNKEYEELT
jgi:hypothetical protein